MTKLFEVAIARVRGLPDSEQDRAAELLMTFADAEDSACQLSDEQAAEVDRRMAEKNPKTLTLAELDDRLRRRGIL
ncbi:MAG: hypothetical protein IT535_13595 [Bauldia sp.]|nr:hypothetical protein [Bauldia sp.]